MFKLVYAAILVPIEKPRYNESYIQNTGLEYGKIWLCYVFLWKLVKPGRRKEELIKTANIQVERSKLTKILCAGLVNCVNKKVAFWPIWVRMVVYSNRKQLKGFVLSGSRKGPIDGMKTFRYVRSYILNNNLRFMLPQHRLCHAKVPPAGSQRCPWNTFKGFTICTYNLHFQYCQEKIKLQLKRFSKREHDSHNISELRVW